MATFSPNLTVGAVENGFTIRAVIDGPNAKYVAEETSSGVVLTSDIIDNLTTADGTKPLSANQGVELLALINGLQETRTVADAAAGDLLTGLNVDDQIVRLDDGDGKWARYRVTAITDGNGNTSTYQKLIDEDQLSAGQAYTGSNGVQLIGFDFSALPDPAGRLTVSAAGIKDQLKRGAALPDAATNDFWYLVGHATLDEGQYESDGNNWLRNGRAL